MTTQEFSNEFDILYNNIMSNLAPGLDEYEKSVFLTLAQEYIVKALYLGTSAGLGPFENTESVRRDLSNLIITSKYDYSGSYNGVATTQYNGELWSIDAEVLYIIQEYYKDSTGKIYDVIPTTYDELQKIIKNPFRGPSDNRMLRLDYSNNQVVLLLKPKNVSPYAGDEDPLYCITYIKKPYPIILTNLDSGLSINNKTTPLKDNDPCELSSSIHRLILTQAVALAAAAYKS